MSNATSEREELSFDTGEGPAHGGGARVIDLATRSARRDDPPRQAEDRAGMYAGLAVVVLLIGLTVWTVRASQSGPDRPSVSRSGQVPGLPDSGPLPEPGDEPMVAIEPPAAPADGDAAPLPAPDLAPVLADPPASGGDSPVASAQPEPQPVVRPPAGPTVVFDGGGGNSLVGFAFDSGGTGEFGGAVKADPAPAVPAGRPGAKVAASRADPGRTVGRGTLIPAILETAIDSDVPGGVRAVVSNTVLSSDGNQTLVPKSSRLIGQYRTRQSNGKKSAFVVWTQIVKPDGAKVDINASTPGSGDKKFFEAFASSRLVSVIAGEAGPSFRARQGEPLRIVAARDLDLSKPR